MKKLIALCTAALLMCLTVSGAFADTRYITINENLSIRNGIHFKATKAEIDAIEKKNEKKGGSDPDGARTFYGKSYDLVYVTQLAGHESYVTYWLDKNGEIDEFQYLFLSGDAYKTVKTALIDKYGNPTNYTFITGTGIDRVANHVEILRPRDKDYASWVIKYNDCFLIIEVKQIYFAEAYMSVYVVNYDVLSYEEMELLDGANDGLLNDL